MRLGWPGGRRVGMAAGCGLLIAAGQAPVGAWYLAVPGLAGLIWLTGLAQNARAAGWTGLFGAAAGFAASLSWLVEPFLIEPEIYGWMAPFALLGMAFGLALFWAAAAMLAHWLCRPAPQQTALMFAVMLAAAELLRGYVFTGFPWASIGHIWVATPMAQLAAYGGAPGLTLLTTLAAAVAAGGVVRGLAGGGVAALLLVAGWGAGLLVLAQPDPPAPAVTLRLVQPNAAQALKWDADQADIYFRRQLAYTAVKPAPDLVIWPETALAYSLERDPQIAAIIAGAAGGAAVALGLQRRDGPLYFNSMAVINEGGAIIARYDKHHLVPFGEYIPFGDLAYQWFGLKAFAARTGYGYAPGPGPATLDLGAKLNAKLGKMLPLICYEAVFPQDLRGTARPGWILQITNDAWFGTLTGPFQHAAQARLRAIEQGLPLVRVANTGVTAVYDARGRVTASLPFGVAAYLDAALPGPLPATPYARFGEGPVLLLLAGLGLGLLARRRRRPA